MHGREYRSIPDLHLGVSLRSFRSEKLALFVKLLLDERAEDAHGVYCELKQSYPIYITRDLELDVEGVGHIKFDISFGGSFFCILSADQLGLEVKPENASKLKEAGLKIRDAVNANIEIQHPTLSHIKSVDLVEIYDKPSHPEATYKNVVVFGDGNIDRSPCGTGTSAKLATLYAKGELKPGEPFVYESILGTLFKGRIVEERKLADFDAIIPEITGSGYILGFSNYVYDPDDALTYGFLLG